MATSWGFPYTTSITGGGDEYTKRLVYIIIKILCQENFAIPAILYPRVLAVFQLRNGSIRL